MQRMLRVVVCSIEALTEWTGKVSLVLLPMAGLLVYEVVARYIFNRPTIWAHEMSLFMYGGAGMLLGAYTLRYKLHITMDLFYRNLPARRKALIDSITAIAFFAFCGVLLWVSWEFFLVSWHIRELNTTLWRPPVYPVKLVIPVAAFLILLQGTAKLIRDLYFAIYGRELI